MTPGSPITTTLLLARHGITDWNRGGRMLGATDVDLNDEGRAQAEAVADRLHRVDISAVYSSDMRRALDTARVIAERQQGLEVVPSPLFREIDHGDWEGLTEEEIHSGWPELSQGRYHRPRPGGGSPEEVRRRALEGLRSIVRANPDATVVVVSHQNTIRWIVAEALGYENSRAGLIRGLAPGEVIAIDAHLDDDRLVLAAPTTLEGDDPELVPVRGSA